MFTNKIFIDIISQHNLIINFDNTNKPIFKPEDDEGYIEYKLRLDCIDNLKIDRMITQMKYRLNEGKLLTNRFIAYYFLGIDDDGTAGYINFEILDNTLKVFKIITEKSNAEIFAEEKLLIDQDRYIAAVCIRKCCNDLYINEFRMSLLGASNHGKTTCISYITYNEKDNGNGSGRMTIFKHSHEQNTGITSSIKHDIFGLKNGVVYNYRSNTLITWDKIVESSDKIISIFDLPGSPKYMRTTNFGISSLRANIHVIVISVLDCYNGEVIYIPNETLWSIETSININIPIFILITKIDLVDKHKLQNFVDYLKDFMNIFNKVLVTCENYAFNSAEIPYIYISNVTGENYDKFIHFIDKLSQNNKSKIVNKSTDNVDFMIYDVINIREIGYIVSGIAIENSIHVGDVLFIGPIDGQFYPVSIIAIRKKQIESNIIYSGESGSIEIRLKLDIEIDKHMSIVSEQLSKKITNHISIKTDMLKALSFGHQYMLYVDNLIEPIILVNKENNIGTFRFVKTNKLYVRNLSKCIIKSDPNYDFSIYGTIINSE